MKISGVVHPRQHDEPDTQKSPQPDQESSEVVSGGGKDSVDRIASISLEVNAVHAVVRFRETWTATNMARIEATRLGLDIRSVVTNVEHGTPEWIYDTFYCARGQAENLIKLHKTQLASDRTSCRSPIANKVRLVLHTAAHLLMLSVRDAIPKSRDLAKAEFSTLRLRLIKIAARVIETASRVRLAFSADHPRRLCSNDCREPSRRSGPERQGIGPFARSIPPTRHQ